MTKAAIYKMFFFTAVVCLFSLCKLSAQDNTLPAYCKIKRAPNDNDANHYITALSTEGAIQNIVSYRPSSYPTDGYVFYEKERVIAKAGDTIALTYAHATSWSISRAWIDWNKDGKFDDTKELVAEFGIIGGDLPRNGLTYNGKIKIPNDAPKGLRIMRIYNVNSYMNDKHPLITSCGNIYVASAQDFLVEIQ